MTRNKERRQRQRFYRLDVITADHRDTDCGRKMCQYVPVDVIADRLVILILSRPSSTYSSHLYAKYLTIESGQFVQLPCSAYDDVGFIFPLQFVTHLLHGRPVKQRNKQTRA